MMSTTQTAAVDAAPPAPNPRGLRAMFLLRTVPRQWPTALRTAVCVVVPAVIGYGAGDLSAGLLASLGGFTGLFGGARPYLNRARLLVTVALVLSVSVGLGIWAGADRWLGVLVVTLIATMATAWCNAFSIQPGAYQIALTCATGTALHAEAHDPLRPALLVLAGGLFACLVHLSGLLVDRHGPERDAVSSAAYDVADFIDAIGTDRAAAAQHEAAVSMHQAWVRLVNQQPHRRHPGNGLLRLREISRKLQLILADAMRRQRPDPDASARARRLGDQACRRVLPDTRVVLQALPLGRPSAASLIRNAVQPHSRSLLVILRVAVAAAASGALGLALGLDHAYWAIAAAVLVLASGWDQRRTVQRGLERTAGTVLGVVLVGLVLAAAPSGLLLVALITVTVFCGQLLVQRNYVSAAVFITCSAMLMSGADKTPDQARALLWARGIDTAVGCAVALLVFVVLSKKSPSAWLPTTLADTVDAAAAAVDQLTPVAVMSVAGLQARRDLQRCVIRLNETYENGINGYPAQRAEAERVWPAVVAAERLAYRVLAEGWRLQEAAESGIRPGGPQEPNDHPPSEGLRRLAGAIRTARYLPQTGAVPSFVSRDVGDLRRVSALWGRPQSPLPAAEHG